MNNVNYNWWNSVKLDDIHSVERLFFENPACLHAYDNWGRSALSYACELGYLDLIHFLYVQNVNINMKDYDSWTPLMCACDSGHAEVVRTLLNFGADVSIKNASGWNALIFASKRGFVEIIHILLDAKANVHDQDNILRTPLMYCFEGSYLDAMILLLKSGANINDLFKRDFQRLKLNVNINTLIDAHLSELTPENLLLWKKQRLRGLFQDKR